MLDTLSVAQELPAGGIDRDQAEVIANAMRKLAEQGDHVTADQFKAGLAEVRTEIAAPRHAALDADRRSAHSIRRPPCPRAERRHGLPAGVRRSRCP